MMIAQSSYFEASGQAAAPILLEILPDLLMDSPRYSQIICSNELLRLVKLR